MEQIAVVEIKNVYGNEVIYPVNSVAQMFAAIAGTKTLTRAVVQQIKALGYSFQVVNQATI